MYVKRILPLFRAVVKFCSTNRLFTLTNKHTYIYKYIYIYIYIHTILLREKDRKKASYVRNAFHPFKPRYVYNSVTFIDNVLLFDF